MGKATKTGGGIFVVGAGGHGGEVQAYLESLAGAPPFLGWIDDKRPEKTWRGAPVLGTVEDLARLVKADPNAQFHYLTAFGGNQVRHEVVARIEKMKVKNLRPFQLVHPMASIGTEIRFGGDVLVAPNVVLTTHVEVGSHVLINVKVSVSHDCKIEDYANLNPGCTVAGNCVIGKGAYIGAGATVIQGIHVGPWSTIGAGSVVIEDVPAGATVVGVPARVIKQQTLKSA